MTLVFDSLQAAVATEARRRWPDLTVVREGLALAEEAGEVCRAILKRDEGRRGSYEDWSANLRRELAQVVIVALNIAALEGFSLADAIQSAFLSWVESDVDHDPVPVLAERIAASRSVEPPLPEPAQPTMDLLAPERRSLSDCCGRSWAVGGRRG